MNTSIWKFLAPMLLVLLYWACNKNSLQLPDREESKVITKQLELNHVQVIEVSLTQDVNEVEGKTTLSFKNISGLTMTKLKVLIEKGNRAESFRYYDSITNQSIISIDTLHTSKSYTCALPFTTGSLSVDQFNIRLISTGGTNQLVSGCYNNVYLAFEDSNKDLIKYGWVNGYVAADGEALFRLKDNAKYYHVTGSFVDTMLFNNAFFKKINTMDSLIGPVTLDIITGARRFDLSNNGLSFRVKLAIPLPDNTNYLFIKTQKK